MAKKVGRKPKPISHGPIPAQPHSAIGQVLKFARQDIEAILVWPERQEHYREFMDEIDAIRKAMADLQARLEKRFKVREQEAEVQEADEQEAEVQEAEVQDAEQQDEPLLQAVSE
jgi:hypothetical protein